MDELLKQIEEKYRERIEASNTALISAQQENSSLLESLEEERRRVKAYFDAKEQKQSAEQILNSTNIDDLINP